jgi:hypothetical protein
MEPKIETIKTLQDEILANLDNIGKIIELPFNKDEPDKRSITITASQCAIYSATSTINGILTSEFVRLSQNSEKQIAELIKLTISTEKLTKKLILVSWILVGVAIVQILVATYQYTKTSIQNEAFNTIYSHKIETIENPVKNIQIYNEKNNPNSNKATPKKQ